MAISSETKSEIKNLDYEDKKHEKRIEEDLHACLKEANLIKQKVKDSELKEKFQEEYNELEDTILESVNDDLKISHNERIKIMLELSDTLTLAEEHGISTNFRKRDSFWGLFSGVTKKDVKRVESESNQLLDKDIKNYTEEEATIILEHLNKEYGDYTEGTFSGLNEESLSELKGMTKKDVQAYQERLIDIIIGKGTNFGNGFIKGFSEKRGFYLVHENNIKTSISNINSDRQLVKNFLLSIVGNENIKSDLIESEVFKILGENLGKEVVLYGNKEGIIDTDGDWKTELIYDAINLFNENLDIETLKSLSWFLPDELNNILDQSGNSDKDKYQILFQISQYIYSLSNSDFIKEYDLRGSFFEKAHDKSTENILSKVLIDNKQVVSYDAITGYNIKETSSFEQEIQTNGAENINKLEIASYLGNLEPSTTSEQLVQTLGKDNVLYIMLLFKSGELIDGFDKVKKVFINFNENNIESFASEYLTSKYFQSADGGELLNNNINKLSPVQKTTLLNIVESNSNICIKCEGGNFEDPITNEILSISKQREISEIYREKQQEFNEKIVTEFLKESGLTELPVELQQQLEQLGGEMFEQASEVIKNEGCAFELMKFIHTHENIKEIEILLQQYGLDVEKFKDLQKSLTETVTTVNVAVNLKKYEIQQDNVQVLEKVVHDNPGNIEFKEQLNLAKDRIIILQKKVAESKRIEKITKVADSKDIEKVIEKLDQGYNREEILNYLVENSENGEIFKEIILEYKDDIKNIDEGTYEEKINQVDSIDKETSQSPIYQDFILDNNGEGSFISSDNIGEKIKISEKEAKIIENNPEGLKNLVDMKTKLDELNLGFVWNFREELISLSGEILGINGINNLDKNFIDKDELNKILNMVLNIAGYNGDAGSISGTYAKIVLLNGVGAISNKRDTIKGLSNIGMIFASNKVGFLNNTNSLQTNWKSNVLNNYKH